MFVPTAVALAAAFWTIVLVALAVEKHVFDPALRLWKSLSKFNKCVVAVILFGVVAFAGTKPLPGGGGDPSGTNVVEIVEGGASTNLVDSVGSQGEDGAEVKVRGEGEQWNLSTCLADQQKEESNILCSPSPSIFTYSSPSPSTFTYSSHTFILKKRKLDTAWDMVKVTQRGFGAVCELVKVEGRKPGFKLEVR